MVLIIRPLAWPRPDQQTFGLAGNVMPAGLGLNYRPDAQGNG
jgi:hypothetical protein